MSEAKNILNPASDNLNSGKPKSLIEDATLQATCQTALGGASSGTEDGLPPKEKVEGQSEHSMASFSNLHVETREDPPMKAAGNPEAKASPLTLKSSSPEKKENKAKSGDLRHESPYYKPEQPLPKHSNESRLKKRKNQAGAKEAGEQEDTTGLMMPYEENERVLTTIQSAGSNPRANSKPAGDHYDGQGAREGHRRGADLRPTGLVCTAEKDKAKNKNRSSSTNQDPLQTPIQVKATDLADAGRTAQGLENFMINLTNQSTRKGTQAYGPKSREINRQFLKRQNEPGERAATISPIRHLDNSSPLKAGEAGEEQQQDAAGGEDKIICLIKTNEPHLRRAVERRSQYWYDSRIRYQGSGYVYDIKFDF